MVTRAGHSLPELIVAVAFLATTVTAVGGMAVLGARWTAEAVLRQEAVRAAGAVLDSVMVAGVSGPGERTHGALTLRWTLDGQRVTVTATEPGRETPLARLSGRPVPAIDVLPDSGTLGPAPPGPAPVW